MTRPARRSLRRLVFPVLLLAGMACALAHRASTAPESDPRGEFLLRVINHHWLDVNIYIVHDGQRTRVGSVTATATQTFVVPGYLLGASRQLSLFGDAIGSQDSVRTETLLVQPGQYIEWTLESSLRRSSVGVY